MHASILWQAIGSIAAVGLFVVAAATFYRKW